MAATEVVFAKNFGNLGLFRSFLSWFDAGGFGDFGQRCFAARGGILFEKAFFDGLVVFGLDLGHALGGRFGFESLEGGANVFFDALVIRGALFCLASSFFGGFDNWH